MPKAKRAVTVNLNKTKGKKKDHKTKHINTCENHLKNYTNVYAFEYFNMVTAPMKELQENIQDSKFCFAKRRLMKVRIEFLILIHYIERYNILAILMIIIARLWIRR